jgi:hypothetical protein
MNELSTTHARIVGKMADSQELGALDRFDLKLLAALEVAAPELSGLARIINDLILPQASVSHVKSSIVLTTLKDSHRPPLRAAKSAS